MEQLSDQEIEARMPALGSAWKREGDAIVGDFGLEDFAAVIALVNRIAAAAEQADHHPDLLIHGYRHLRVTLSTHSAGGLTQRDFELARTIDSL